MPTLVLALLFSLLSAHSPAGAETACGTHLLRRLSSLPRSAAKLQPSPLSLGQNLLLPAFSFQIITGGPYETTATVRHVGRHCYILVEDDVWQSRVDADDIASIASAFEDATPADPDRGIFDIDTALFGSPPDVDADPRILILLLDIQDSPITGTTFVGYFDTKNEAPPTSREIIYIDVNPLDPTSTLARATLAHEFRHMLHWNADPDEEKWIDEGCSEYAELACGYKATDTSAAQAFLVESGANTSLTTWDDAPWEFDQSFLWTTYFVQRTSEETLGALVANTGNGIAAVDEALASFGADLAFESLHADWAAALYLDETGDLGVDAIDLAPVRRDTFQVPTVGAQRSVRLWGIDYLAVDSPGRTVALDIAPSGDNALIVVTLARTPTSTVVGRARVQPGTQRRVSVHNADVLAFAVTGISGNDEAYAFSLVELPAADVADFDADGEVGFSDFILFAEGFGRSGNDRSYDPTLDLDADRSVGFTDFVQFAQQFGR